MLGCDPAPEELKKKKSPADSGGSKLFGMEAEFTLEEIGLLLL